MKKTNPQIRKVGATGPDQKTAFVNEAANDADLQRMIDRFRAGDWPFLLLETEQCRISVRTLDAPEGNCTVTIILKLHGQFYGTSDVEQRKKPGGKRKLPVRHSLFLSSPFGVWVKMWVNQLTHILTHTKKSKIATKKPRKPKFSRLFVGC